jgi:hypothetical protein
MHFLFLATETETYQKDLLLKGDWGSSCGYRMMGITKQKFGNGHEMSINEFSHYSLFLGLFVAFTYNKKQPPAFGAAPAFWCILLPFLGLLFRHNSK